MSDPYREQPPAAKRPCAFCRPDLYQPESHVDFADVCAEHRSLYHSVWVSVNQQEQWESIVREAKRR